MEDGYREKDLEVDREGHFSLLLYDQSQQAIDDAESKATERTRRPTSTC